MASTSSSSPHKWTYDVFLSFRGEDTRTNFVDHLYTALTDRGIFTFKDDQTLHKGKSVSPELLQAIEQSRFAIVIFSKNYADSLWCLGELVKIIHCRNSINQTVLPVFYDVDPSEVRKQTDDFGKAFSKHKINRGKDDSEIQSWRHALAEAASISGWDLPKTTNGHESQCIKQIVKIILRILANVTSSTHLGNLIGMESRVQNLKSLLLKAAEDKVQMVGIWGMGGAGKTTLARAVFSDIANQFDGISFVENVREDSRTISGLRSLQQKALSEILMQRGLKVSSVDNGINMMSRLCYKKVLLVLDDVDHVDQLEALVGKRDWFGKGSRIIITTRNEHLLVIQEVDEIHRIVLLNYDESLSLFNKHAFKSKIPLEEFKDLSEAIVHEVGGLPLALKILGSDLCYRRTMAEWKGVVNKLKQHEHNKEILGVLKISYDSLERNEQEVFLDIACFFLEEKKDDVLEDLDCFGYKSGYGLSVLIEKCLLDVHAGKLQMHDLIKELAWDIVYQMDPKEPGKRSRLWRLEDIQSVLDNDTGTTAVEGIKFVTTGKAHNFEALKNMKKLRLLDVSHGNIYQGTKLKYLSSELCLIRWEGYPSESLPPCFRADKLVSLHLKYSNIVRPWEGRKILDKLKSVDLSYSIRLIGIPDLSGCPNLEKLYLCNCIELEEVHPSLGDLQKLIFLDLQGCSRLEWFPSSFNMTSLEILNLKYCRRVSVFPQIVGDMKRLREMHFDGTAIKKVHHSIGKLTGLVKLNLSSCEKLKHLPSTIGNLKCLKTLDLSDCSRLEELPETLQELECLEELFIIRTEIKQLPSLPLNLIALSIGDYGTEPMSLLTSSFPHLSLKNLSLFGLNNIEPPSSISQFTYLETLDLSWNTFTYIPDVLCLLSRLKELNLSRSMCLKVLPKLPSSIAKLNMDYCVSLESVGCLLTTKHEFLYDVSFRDCLKWVDNEQRSRNSTSSMADILLQTMLQRRSIIKHHEFHISLPGSKSPDWISIKSEENIGNPSLKFKLLPNWDTNIAGFAMSYEMVPNVCELSITIFLGHKYNHKIDAHKGWSSSECSHICVRYISLDYLGQLIFGDTYKKEDYWIGGNDAIFQFEIHYPSPKISYQRFGTHIVYKDDTKHIYNYI